MVWYEDKDEVLVLTEDGELIPEYLHDSWYSYKMERNYNGYY